MTTLVDILMKVDTSQLKDAKTALGDIGTKIPSVEGAVDKLVEKFKSLGEAALAGEASMAMLGGEMLAVVAVAGMLGIAMAFEWANKIEELTNLGNKYGFTADQMYYMKKAAEDAGVSIEDVIKGSDRLAKSMALTGNATSKQSQSFAALGVSTLDVNGHLRSTTAVMDDIISKTDINNLSTSQQAALMVTLGKGYRDVVIARNAELESLERANTMYEAGIGISKESQAAVEANRKTMADMGAVMNDVGSKLVQMVLPPFTALIDIMVNSYKQGGAVKVAFDLMGDATWLLVNALKGLVTIWDTVVTAMGTALDALIAAWMKFSTVITTVIDMVKAVAAHGWNADLTTIWKKGADDRQQIDKDFMNLSRDRWAAYAADQKKLWAGTLTTPSKTLTAPTNNGSTLGGGDALATSKTWSDSSKKDAEQMAAYAQKYANIVQDIVDKQKMTTAELDKQKQIQGLQLLTNKQIAAIADDDPDRQSKILAILKDQKDTTAQIAISNQQLADNSDSFIAGMESGWTQIKNNLTDFNTQAKNFTINSFNSMTDALTNFVSTGKASFSSLALSILADLEKMIAKQLVMNALAAFGKTSAGTSIMGFMGFADGGAFSGGNVIPMASGNIVSSPTIFPMANGTGLMGEAGPEAVMPLTRMNGGKLGVMSTGGSGSNSGVTVGSINVTVQGNQGQTPADQAKMIGSAITDQLKTLINGELRNSMRSGNILNQVKTNTGFA